MKRTNKIFEFVLFCLVLIVILTPLSGCGINPAESTGTAFETSSATSLDESSIVPQDFVVPDWVTDYPSIIKEYQKFVDYLLNDGIESVFDNNVFSTPDSNLAYNWDCMIIETNIWSYRDFPKTKEAFGYALEDLNGDGNTELILLLQDYTVLAVFSTANGEPKLLDAFWSRHRCAIYESGLLYTLSSSGADDWYYAIQRISPDGSQLLQVEKYGNTSQGEHPGYYKMIGGETYNISESEINEFHDKFPILSDITASEITKNSGVKLIPLFD